MLVTGAAGFVGSHLLDRLLADGQPVVGWYRPGTDPSLLRPSVSWKEIELLDRQSVDRAIAELRPRAVYHLAAAAHVAQSWQFAAETYQINVIATHHLLDALATLADRPRVLVTGSATVYKATAHPLTEAAAVAPASPYALSKLTQERLAQRCHQEEGLPILIARAFNHTGTRQDPSYVASGVARQIALIEAGLQTPVLRMGNLDPIRDLSDVRDVVRAYIVMTERATPGQPYNICSGRGRSIRELIETFTSAAHTPMTIEQDAALFRPNDTPILVGDHRRLSNETGWQPEIPFSKTAEDLLGYWRGRVANGIG